MFPIAISVVLMVLDQLLKSWANKTLELISGVKVIIPGVLQMTNIHNEGAVLGILKNAQFVLVIILVTFVAACIFALIKGYVRSASGKTALLLMLGGALGNGIDRIIFGYVVDMIEFTILPFPIFNIADCMIVVGGVWLCIHVLRFKLTGGASARDDGDETDEFAALRANPPRRQPEADPERRMQRQPQRNPQRAPQQGGVPRQRLPYAEGEQERRPVRAGQQPARRPAAEGEELRRPVRPAAEGEQMQRPIRPAQPARRPAAEGEELRRPVRPAAEGEQMQRPVRPAQPSVRPVPAEEAAQRPARHAAPETEQAQRPVRPPQQPARRPAPAPVSDELDLDSILAEFK